jgi:succinoglycan biosynthesis transport protein ExoP
LDQLSLSLGFDKDPVVIRRAELAHETTQSEVSLWDLTMRQLRGMLRKRIEVERVGPGLFEVSYLDANPEACYIIAEAMGKLYVEEQQKQQLDKLRGVSDFSEEQLSVYKERLDQSERDLEAFQRKMSRKIVDSNPVTDVNIGAARSLKRQLEVEVADLNNVIANIRTRIQSYVGKIPDSDRILSDHEVRNLRDDLLAGVDTDLLRELRATQGPAPPGAGTTSEVVATKRDLMNRISELLRAEYPDIQRDYRPLVDEYVYQSIQFRTKEHKLEKLNTYITTFYNNVELAPEMNSELRRLQGEVDRNRTLYEEFLRAKTTTTITEAAQNNDLATSTTVVENATFPLEPVKPNKIKILALALVFGLTLGMGGLLLSEFSDSSLRSVDEVEKKMGLRVVGTVPRIERMGGAWKGENRVKKVAIWGTTGIVLAAVTIFAFYFYGKATKENMVTFRMSKAQQTARDRN